MYTKGASARAALIAIAAALTLGGCCKDYKQEIASQKDEMGKLRIDMDELREQRDDLEARVVDLTADKKRLDEKVTSYDARIRALVEYQQELEKELEKLGGDKTEMAARYKEAMAEQQRLIDEMKKRQARAEKRMETLRGMLSKFKSLIEGGKLNVRIRDGKLMLELPSAVLFPSGKAEISEDGMETLGQVAEVLSQIEDREFQIAGHTDNVPITSGRFEDNWELSTARSVSVVRALQEMGVDPTSLAASGYSKYQPTVPNDSKKNRRLNRRIEIVLMPNLDELPDLSELESELKKD
ncbi:MAG: OmpA family protein [Polyangia bacterium]